MEWKSSDASAHSVQPTEKKFEKSLKKTLDKHQNP